MTRNDHCVQWRHILYLYLALDDHLLQAIYTQANTPSKG